MWSLILKVKGAEASACEITKIPTLSKISSYQFLPILLEGTNHEQSLQNNHSS